MPRKAESDVEEDAVIEEEDTQEDQENADDEEGSVDQDDSDDLVDEDPDDDSDDDQEDELDPALIEFADKNGMSETEARSIGNWPGVAAVIAARKQQKADEKKEPEDDPFVLKLTDEEIAELPPSIARELGRIAKAAKAGIESAKEKVGPLEEHLRVLTGEIQRIRQKEAFEVFNDWCDRQDESYGLGTKDKPNPKRRAKIWNKGGDLGKKSPTLTIEDASNIALNSLFKGKQNQKARRDLVKAAKKHSESAVGRASTVRSPVGKNGTRKTSVDSVRALYRKAGMV